MWSSKEILGLLFQLRNGSGNIPTMSTPAVIRRGSSGEDVKTWQNVLLRDPKPLSWITSTGVPRTWPANWAWPIAADGSFGSYTQAATESWQARRGLTVDGVVGPKTWARALGAAAEPVQTPSIPTPVSIPPIAPQPGGYPFVQAKNFTTANRTKIDLVVIHDMEYPERPDGAEWCAAFFAGPNAPKASAHFCVDNNSIVQCVKEKDVAWHAPGANNNGIGIEHAGYAKQTREQWLDEYSTAELKLSAKLTAEICKRWDIPIVKLSAEDLKAKKRGICGHKDATDAFSNGKGHWDPGPNFVWDLYIQWVQEAADELELPEC